MPCRLLTSQGLNQILNLLKDFHLSYTAKTFFQLKNDNKLWWYFILFSAISLLIVFFKFKSLIYQNFLLDDALFFVRYASNFLYGGGWSWNDLVALGRSGGGGGWVGGGVCVLVGAWVSGVRCGCVGGGGRCCKVYVGGVGWWSRSESGG